MQDELLRTDESEPLRVYRGPISMQVEVQDYAGRLLIIYEFETRSEGPVIVSFVDEFLGMEPNRLGFHPDAAPISCQSDEAGIIVDHRVDPDEASRLVLEVDAPNECSAIDDICKPSILDVEETGFGQGATSAPLRRVIEAVRAIFEDDPPPSAKS